MLDVLQQIVAAHLAGQRRRHAVADLLGMDLRPSHRRRAEQVADVLDLPAAGQYPGPGRGDRGGDRAAHDDVERAQRRPDRQRDIADRAGRCRQAAKVPALAEVPAVDHHREEHRAARQPEIRERAVGGDRSKP